MRASRHSRIVVIGQAPGSKVHASGVPWDDPSGDHLREWLDVESADFHDPDQFAILPMGFCYPGKGKSADLPPRPECAPLWHQRVLDAMQPSLNLLVGQYAQAAYLPERRRTLTETVRSFRDYGDHFPLPHPSWRSRGWRKRNPWFDADVLPVLRQRVHAALAEPSG
ncbi:MAG: uracil-DNA glycosylase family protein [Proteobacteria bacterium]|nr:uracil-DNA glycosylase family protein [Pseudomonadota bacterium]